MYNWDYDIRKTFDSYLGEDMFFSLDNIISDYDLLRLATEFLRFAMERLDSDLSDDKIFEEYNKIGAIINQLEDIIKNYK